MSDPAQAPASGAPFVHLHTHTEYSLLDGAARIGELVETAKAMGQPAVAMTDHGVLYGTVDFYNTARAAGINPIVGCEVYMAPRSRHDKEGRADRDPNHLILLARNLTGYRNLIKLVSRAHLEGYYYKPRVDKELLAEHAEGLVCLSACIGGELPQAILGGDMDNAERVARQHMEIFGPDSYFLELQDHGISEETEIRRGLLEIARRTGLPLIATNDSHYINAQDAEAHDILLCIQTSSRQEEEKRFKFHGPHFYLASGDEMAARFADYGEAVRNTVALAQSVDLQLPMGTNLLPRYQPIPEGHSAESYLRELCAAGLGERYGDAPSAEARQRLEMELAVIEETGFAPYFLIVWDLIRAARCNGVAVGPGRGSAAGSLVSYVLRITNICPLRYGLIFERFLNRERVEMPDIDIDFDDQRRDRVIAYAGDKYGADRVAQIITFGTMAARAAIRDVGRALNVPLPDVDRLAKLVPPTIGITLDRALRESKDLREVYDAEEWARRVIDNAQRLEGICRNASTHAAGVVIGPEPLENIVPLQRSTTGDRDAAVTQFDMRSVSKIGLLKIDFLGLANLSVIEECVRTIAALHGTSIDIDSISLEDGPTYDLLCKADTHGIFQFEGTFAKRILLDMQPRSLEDIAVAGALNRPGPIEGGVVDIYLRRKRGEEPVEYLLPQLETVLAETHGAIVYQDQVMKIASLVAGFSLGEADLLRGAMGKKDKVKMAKQREKFLAGAKANGVDEAKAVEIFDLMAFFAGYGFNKAHSVAYGLISYQTAYLKANHPLEYMAALMNSRAGDFDKLTQSIQDAHARSLVVHKPEINRSSAGFAVGDVESGEILYGLSCIKGVGEKVAEEIIAIREAEGPFTSLFDLCLRVGSRDLNRRVMEALIKSGACDELGERGPLLASLDRSMDRASAIRRERESGQTSLFGDTVSVDVEVSGTAVEEISGREQATVLAPDDTLSWERDLLGVYLSDHPLRRIAETLHERVDTSLNELGAHLDGLYVQVGGTVREIRAFVPRRSTTGQRMAFLQLEDLTGSCEVVVFARCFEECAALLKQDAVVVVRGKVETSRNGIAAAPASEDDEQTEPAKIIAEAVYAIDDARLVAWRRNCAVHVRLSDGQQQLVGALRHAIEEHRGEAPVVLHIESRASVDEITLPDGWRVEPGPALERAVEALFGEGTYRLEVQRQRAEERERRPARR